MSTLLIGKNRFYPFRQAEENREYADVDDIGGRDILEFLQGEFVPGNKFELSKGRMARVRSVTHLQRGMLADVGAGRPGQEGDVWKEEELAYRITREQAALMSARMLTIAPPGSREMFTFIERYPGNAPGITCLDGLRKAWRDRQPGFTWDKSWVEYGNQFLEEAELKEFEIRRMRTSGSTASSAITDIGSLSYSATAPRGHMFSRTLKEKLLKDSSAAYDTFELTPVKDDQTVLHLRSGSLSKTYIVEKGDLPKVQIQLPDNMTDEAFIQECQEHLTEVCELSLDPNWCSRS